MGFNRHCKARSCIAQPRHPWFFGLRDSYTDDLIWTVPCINRSVHQWYYMHCMEASFNNLTWNASLQSDWNVLWGSPFHSLKSAFYGMNSAFYKSWTFTRDQTLVLTVVVRGNYCPNVRWTRNVNHGPLFPECVSFPCNNHHGNWISSLSYSKMNALSSGLLHVLSKGTIEPLLFELRQSAHILDPCLQLSRDERGPILQVRIALCFFCLCACFFPRLLLQMGKLSGSKQIIYYKWS